MLKLLVTSSSVQAASLWCTSNFLKKLASKVTTYSVINNGCTTVKSSDWSVISYDALSEEDLVYLDQLTQEIYPQLSLFD